MGLATGMAVASLGSTVLSTANSFIQADQQSKLQRRAEAEAAKAMAEARKRLEINFAKMRAIQKEPYELQREAFLSAGAQAIEAGVESDRGPETTVGKVLMAQNEAQAGVRTNMIQDMDAIQREIIAEEARLRDLNVQLDLGVVEGANLAAKDAEEAAAAATQQGFEGITSATQQGLAMVPLFAKRDDPAVIEGLSSAPLVNNKTQNLPSAKFPTSAQLNPITNPLYGMNFSGVGF
jgi:hypothetical protein